MIHFVCQWYLGRNLLNSKEPFRLYFLCVLSLQILGFICLAPLALRLPPARWPLQQPRPSARFAQLRWRKSGLEEFASARVELLKWFRLFSDQKSFCLCESTCIHVENMFFFEQTRIAEQFCWSLLGHKLLASSPTLFSHAGEPSPVEMPVPTYVCGDKVSIMSLMR